MADDSYVPPIDYTSRDYLSIRQDLLNLIQTRVPQWTARNPGDFGVVLLEAFAAAHDVLNYYVDKAASEAFLNTASQRSSVLAIANMLGYTPTSTSPASVTLTFSNSSASSALIPAGTSVATVIYDSNGLATSISFETASDLTVASSSTGTVTATQTTTYSNESVGVSDGSASQDFTLFNTPVWNSSVRVFVDELNSTLEWTQVNNLLEYDSTDPVFAVYTDDNGVSHIVFGDNEAGRIPVNGAIITATYKTTNGASGNVASGTLTSITSAVPAGVTANNISAASGGTDDESTTSIRNNATSALTTTSRAVTLADLENLSVSSGIVAKAQAKASTFTNVVLTAAPFGGGSLSSATTTALQTYLSSRVLAGTTVTVQSPTYVTVDITVSITAQPQYRQNAVQLAVQSALSSLLSFDNVAFGVGLAQGTVIAAAQLSPGVQTVSLTQLTRTGANAVNDISVFDGELLQIGTLTITVTGGTV